MGASLYAKAADLIGNDAWQEVSDATSSPRPLAEEILSSISSEELLPAQTSDGVPVVVARTKSGRLIVAKDNCPHDGGLLSTGFVEGERIVCNRHGWEFECPYTNGQNPDACPSKKDVDVLVRRNDFHSQR